MRGREYQTLSWDMVKIDYRMSVSDHVCAKIWEGNDLPVYSETRVLSFWGVMLLCV
jgi:hypothetical protein